MLSAERRHARLRRQTRSQTHTETEQTESPKARPCQSVAGVKRPVGGLDLPSLLLREGKKKKKVANVENGGGERGWDGAVQSELCARKVEYFTWQQITGRGDSRPRRCLSPESTRSL